MMQIYIESYFKGFRKFLKNHKDWKVVEKRVRIIEFYDKSLILVCCANGTGRRTHELLV